MTEVVLKKKTFEELTVGHTFQYGKKEPKLPEKTYFWCSFCGGRGRIAHTIIRDDGLELKVGTTCLKRVGLEAPVEIVPEVSKKVSSPVPTQEASLKEGVAGEAAKEGEDLSDEALDAVFNEAEEKK